MRKRGMYVTFEKNSKKYAIKCNTLDEQYKVVCEVIYKDCEKIRYNGSIEVMNYDKIIGYDRFFKNPNFMNDGIIPIMENETYEYCSYCGDEVIIKADCTIKQICPTCGKPIIACSMCTTMDCNNCKLCKKSS